MKNIFKYSLISLVIMLFITYYLGWKEMITNKQLTGNLVIDFLKSIRYYFLWVIPYWWLLIIIGTIFLTLLGYGIKLGIEKFRA